MWRTVVSAVAVYLASQCLLAQAGGFIDPLDEPAEQSALAASSMVNAVAVAGQSLVAVGARGHVLVSDDEGASWTQAAVPLSTDLVAVHFPTAKQGWAVGHDSVVIHTRDGGKTWTRQLDGRKALLLLRQRYPQSSADDKQTAAIARSIEITMSQSASPDCLPLPLLDVWFENDKVGYVVGAFNLMFRTLDGGEHWEPWLHQVDNPREYNLHAIRGDGDAVYIVGERGLLLKQDRPEGRFTSLPVGYEGSFFGLIADHGLLVVYGMRGHAFLSADAGAQFRPLALGTSQSIVGGGSLGDGRIALASQGGKVFVSDTGVTRLQALSSRSLGGVLGATPIGSDALALATGSGVTKAQISSSESIGIDTADSRPVARH